MVMTADNSFELWVNGKRAGAGDNWAHSYTMDCTRLLEPGTNLLAVLAVNGADAPNPAGLIGRLIVKYRGWPHRRGAHRQSMGISHRRRRQLALRGRGPGRLAAGDGIGSRGNGALGRR